jgi:preprotein translocase subunit YajC
MITGEQWVLVILIMVIMYLLGWLTLYYFQKKQRDKRIKEMERAQAERRRIRESAKSNRRPIDNA